MIYYKTLSPGRIGLNSRWQWPETGEWTPRHDGDLSECSSGYHLCRRQDVVCWLDAEIYEAEIDGEVVECADKVICRRARLTRHIGVWDDRTARLFACDCADRVISYWTAAHPDDPRPANAITVARRYANGEASSKDLIAAKAAAEASVWDAGADAIWFAAWAAGGGTRYAARHAAWAAARDASWDARAARAAALAAARDAAWDAAMDAAWAAAWAAAGAAAWAAAWAAARDAAWDAAWAAARDAERAWQTERLFWYLSGDGRRKA